MPLRVCTLLILALCTVLGACGGGGGGDQPVGGAGAQHSFVGSWRLFREGVLDPDTGWRKVPPVLPDEGGGNPPPVGTPALLRQDGPAVTLVTEGRTLSATLANPVPGPDAPSFTALGAYLVGSTIYTEVWTVGFRGQTVAGKFVANELVAQVDLAWEFNGLPVRARWWVRGLR